MAGVPLAVGSIVAGEAPAGEDNVPEAAERFEGGTTTAVEAPTVTGDARCEGDWLDGDILAEATALSLEAAIVVLRDVSAVQGAAIAGGRAGPLVRALRALGASDAVIAWTLRLDDASARARRSVLQQGSHAGLAPEDADTDEEQAQGDATETAGLESGAPVLRHAHRRRRQRPQRRRGVGDGWH